MAYTNLPQLIADINTFITTNGVKSITGAKMNQILNGLVQFGPSTNMITTGTATGTAGGSGFVPIVIPHGMSTTPKFAVIANKLAGVDIFSNGYYFSYDATNITIKFNPPAATGSPAPFNIDWFAV